MKQLAYEHAVFLSPHHDDICFSVACIVLNQASGDLVNIFTRSQYIQRSMTLPTERNGRIDFITRLRTAEDVRFAEAVGLARYDLMLSDAPVRGFEPFDSNNLSSELAEVRAALNVFLESRFKPGVTRPPSALFCPMGIGGHRDHLLTLLAVKGMMTLLLGHFDLLFYEDLHYASNAAVRKAGIDRALAIMSGFQMSRTRVALSQDLFARKLELLALYDSQFGSPIRAMDFIPADEEVPTPHEAVWRCRA